MLVSLIVSIFLLASSAFAQGQQCPRFTVRKEMNDLTEQEWQTYLSTIVESTRRIDPESGLTIWEAGVRRHSQFSAENHGSAAFLYFHRHYLTWMERKLQTINPNFAFFYWDSAREFNTWTRSRIWTRLGTARAGQPVTDGPFANVFFRSSNTFLIRDWNFPTTAENPPSVEFLSQMFQSSLSAANGYDNYNSAAEFAHASIHMLVGGNNGAMGNVAQSPLDPFFYAHHAHYDYLFLQAQIGWRAAGRPLSFSIGGTLRNGQTLDLNTIIAGTDNATVSSYMDPADLCVRYARPGGDIDDLSTTTSRGPPPVISTSSFRAITSSSIPALITTTSLVVPGTTTSLIVPGTTTSLVIPGTTRSLVISGTTTSAIIPGKTTISAPLFVTSSSNVFPIPSSLATSLFPVSSSNSVPSPSLTVISSTTYGIYPSSTTGLPAPATSAVVPPVSVSPSIQPTTTSSAPGPVPTICFFNAMCYSYNIPIRHGQTLQNLFRQYFPPTYDPRAHFSLRLPQRWIDQTFGRERGAQVKARMDQITAQVQQKAAAGVSIPLPPLALDTAGRIYVGSAPIDVVPGNESAVVVPPFGVTLSVSVQQSVVVSATSSSMAVSSSTALALPVSVASVSTLLKSSVTLPSSVPPAVYGSPAPRSTGRSPVVISSSSRLVFGGALAALPWILAF